MSPQSLTTNRRTSKIKYRKTGRCVFGLGLTANLLFSGCSSLRTQTDQIANWNAKPLAPTLSQDVDLIVLLQNQRVSENSDKALDAAFVEFSKLPSVEYKQRRNDVQDRLKLTSDNLCDQYKSDLMRKEARGNFLLGAAALLFGSAGAIATNVNAARAFSGSSAFFTGTRSEINQDFYLNQTIPAITKAIDKKQEVVWQVVLKNRQADSAAYSIYLALDDISKYHAACSLAGAMDLTDKAIAEYDVVAAVEKATASADQLTKLRKAVTSVSAETGGSGGGASTEAATGRGGAASVPSTPASAVVSSPAASSTSGPIDRVKKPN